MENNSQPPFHLWQKVVALRDHSESLFKKGDVFTVTEIMKTPCNCSQWMVRIGNVFGYGRGTFCKKCCVSISTFGPLWFHSFVFAPYNPPRHESVEIAEDILKMEIVEERADVAPERVLND